jgi:polysaccharide export outer membrane protein
MILPLLLLAGCVQLPTSGPAAGQIQQQTTAPGATAVQVVDVDEEVVRRLAQQRRVQRFSDSLGLDRGAAFKIGSGDTLEVSIWEAPPATLFGGGVIDPRTPSSVKATTLPEQVVDRDGEISVPFAGRVAAAGRTPQAVENEIVQRLRGKANQPEVLVRVLRNASAGVTVVGEVTTSLRMPLTPGGERLLDALAAAGGVKQPIGKTTVQITRGENFYSMPLDSVIRDPRQNVPLRPGDVVTALFQPLSFSALGATGKNEEVPFEGQGINLAQALARAGGLRDERADAQGVFIFRFEHSTPAVNGAPPSVPPLADGTVPVVYRINLRDPRSFFVMQGFAIQDRDVLYVSNAPAAELQKFLNLIFSVAYPVLNTVQLTR